MIDYLIYLDKSDMDKGTRDKIIDVVKEIAITTITSSVPVLIAVLTKKFHK